MQTRMTWTLLLLMLASLRIPSVAASDSSLLSEGWRFQLGCAPEAVAAPDFNDSAWREVRVPHDWAIEGSFAAGGDGGTGRLPWRGHGWYRRGFDLPTDGHARRVYLDFDGVMAFPKIYINGQLAGEWDYGYTSFRIDATPYVRWGASNVIAVHVDTSRWGSRWYPGAGIYRKVSLTISDDLHLAQWGIQVRTDGGEDADKDPDTAHVRTTVENHQEHAATVRVQHTLLDPDGHAVASSESALPVPAAGEAVDEQTMQVADPLLWDVDHPHLYTLQTGIVRDDNLVDLRVTRIGFRTFAFTADDGFHLNGRRVQMYGVNNHHDLGPLGGAFNRRAAQRQLEILKDMGANALRTAHNPPAPEVLDLCDEMGLLVWDEVFDKYAWTAGRPDLKPALPTFSRRHIEATVKRDINHPCVVVWSTGNEVSGGEHQEGIRPERVKMMADFVREFDRTRPVAQGCHIPSMVDGKNFAALDLTGWNYSRRYANYREQYPDRAIIYSESASTFSTRGHYDPALPNRPTDYASAYQVSSYDLQAAAWSDIPDAEFRLMEQDRFVAGEFVWTGFDYLGEPTPFAEHARSSYFGIVDLCGFPKDRFYLYRSHWRKHVPTVHVLPHWNWPDRVGQNVPVFLYTNGDAAELFLNGRSLGMRRKGEIPPRLPNLALGGTVTASSSATEHPAAAAADGDMASEWRADSQAPDSWWQIDLGQPQTIATISIDTLQKENNYAYAIDASPDSREWTPLVDHPTRPYPRWNGPTRMFHTLEPTEWRYLRMRFDHVANRAPIGLKEFMVYSGPVENDYYDVTYAYRLRWNDVTYEPGALRAVAYRDGIPIGEAVVETTGTPIALRLTADRNEIRADGEDLAYITVEAVDDRGRPHPLAQHLVHFKIEGAGRIAGVGNGNPLSFEPHVSDRHHLSYGKALLIVRPNTGAGGPISIQASSPELKGADLQIHAQP